MPVGAVIGSAVVGAGSTALGASKNASAINKANQAQQESTAQQLAFQREARDENKAALSPFMTRGNAAGDQINALLGLSTGPTTDWNAFLNSEQALQDEYNQYYRGTPGSIDNLSVEDFGKLKVADDLRQHQGQAGYQGYNLQPFTTDGASSATAAYEKFKQSTGYTDRLAEGYRGVNAGYAGRRLLQSGAAQKALLRYGQSQASNEFGNYLGALTTQQNTGLAGASALAGVGQNFANNASNISQNAATAAGQAAVASANNSNSAFGSIANIAGQTAGALSSYGAGLPPITSTPYNPNAITVTRGAGFY